MVEHVSAIACMFACEITVTVEYELAPAYAQEIKEVNEEVGGGRV